MVKVSPEYHEVYGLSLNVLDIEPTYTVGEIVVRKQKILEKLKNEGVINMNKELDMSYIPHRIAIISSKTAAGYEDFVDQLTSNSHNFRFYIKLFPAVMQGNEAESSIIKQLDKIYQHTDNFDAVVIIRGGGAQADLDCFNSYWLAYNITQFPLPVLTGIGHEQDDSVVDMVAHTRLKTPTAVAEHLIDSLVVVESDLLETEEQIVDVTREIINNNRDKLKDFAYSLNKEIHTIILKENKKLSGVYSTYILSTRYKLSNQKVKLVRCMASLEQKENLYLSKKSELLRTEIHQMKSKLKLKFAGLNYNLLSFNQAIELHSPSTILGKGYSITTHNGKIVKDGSKLSHGDEIKTVYFKGKTNSKIL
jgi:exodeoxyribonuclease VII large subunit